jgi:hypothetical protein
MYKHVKSKMISFSFFGVLGIKPKAMRMLGKCSIT